MAATNYLFSVILFSSKKMTLQEVQDQVDAWIKAYGVRYFSELTNLAILTEEVGELAQHQLG